MAKKKKKKTKKKTKKKAPLQIDKGTPSLEIYLEGGLVTAIRSSISLVFRVISLDDIDPEKNEAPAIAAGYTTEGGQTVSPTYNKMWLKDYGV